MTVREDIYVGRQPIYDRHLAVVAYELLFRSSEHNAAIIDNAEQATSQIIANTFADIGLDRIVGRHRAYLNVTRDFLLGDYPLPPSECDVALEILEETLVDDELLSTLERLRGEGYTVVLDDFVYHPNLQPLVSLADIVKIDVLALDMNEVRRHVEELRRFPVTLLAEKVENQEVFERCRDMGFGLFQGFFFCKPNVVRGERLPANRLAMLRLLSVLQNPDTDFNLMEESVSQDPSLSYKLLRMINSAYFGLPRKVESIRQALVILGQRKLRNWVSLIALSRVEGKPQELLITALVRAKMCELLAVSLGRRDADMFFTVGLFSVLDALLDRPMEELLAALPLADEINRALLAGEGTSGRVLKCVLGYERGEWEQAHCEELGDASAGAAYLEAISWADGVAGQLAA